MQPSRPTAHPFTVIIPARLGSTRLPNKPLQPIAGVPMVVRVARQAMLSAAERVVVATDDQQILDCCQQHHVEACLTPSDCATGSDRVAHATRLLDLPADAIVVNLQGDEPFMDPALINTCAARLAQELNPSELAGAMLRRPASIATLAIPLRDWQGLLNPNVVKVVMDKHGLALYFSRAPIPFPRDLLVNMSGDTDQAPSLNVQPRLGIVNQGDVAHRLPTHFQAHRHLGLYAYPNCVLQDFVRWPSHPLDHWEALEQLRLLAEGHAIAVAVVDPKLPQLSIDTPQDLAMAQAIAEQQRV